MVRKSPQYTSVYFYSAVWSGDRLHEPDSPMVDRSFLGCKKQERVCNEFGPHVDGVMVNKPRARALGRLGAISRAFAQSGAWLVSNMVSQGSYSSFVLTPLTRLAALTET